MPWNPLGALIGPLGLLALVYGRRRKGSKAGMLLALLLVGVSVGMALAACGPGGGGSSSPTAPPLPTPVLVITPGLAITIGPGTSSNSTPSPSGTPTPILEIPECPTAPTGIPTPGPTQTLIYAGPAITSGYYIPTESQAKNNVPNSRSIPIPAPDWSGFLYLSTNVGHFSNDTADLPAQDANEYFLYYHDFVCLQGTGQLDNGNYITCDNPNKLWWDGLANDQIRQSVKFNWPPDMERVNKLVANPFKTAAVCKKSYPHEKIWLKGMEGHLAAYGNPEAILDVVDVGDRLCPWNNPTGDYYIDIFTGVGVDAFKAYERLKGYPVEVYIVSYSD